MMHSLWVPNGNVKLKVHENILVLLVTSASNLEKHFDINKLSGDAEE